MEQQLNEYPFEHFDRAIPEPMYSKVKQECANRVTDASHKDEYMAGAQYGFNLRDIFCDDLKKNIIGLLAEVAEYTQMKDRYATLIVDCGNLKAQYEKLNKGSLLSADGGD